MRKFQLLAGLLFAIALSLGIYKTGSTISHPSHSAEVGSDKSQATAKFADDSVDTSRREASQATSNGNAIPEALASISSPLSKNSALVTALAAITQQPVLIKNGGMNRPMVLAMDELYVRDADGHGSVISIPPAADAADLLTAIEKTAAAKNAQPELVMYPAGLPRNEATRRVVTRDLVIEADSRSTANSLATASGLSFKSAPTYARGKYIYEAPSSPEALAFFLKTADTSASSITPLLASKVAKMVMPNDPLVKKQWHLKFQNQLGALPDTDLDVEPVWKYPSTKVFSSNFTTGYIRGNGTTIGIVDDGLQWSHPDLLPNVIKELQRDWNGKDFDPKPYYWNDVHGTACAGVAAARGNNKIGGSGVAPEASLVGMRLIADYFTDSDSAEAMTWKSDAIHIKSNSWGYYAFDTDTHYPTGIFTSWNPIVEMGQLTEDALEYAAKYGRNGKGSIITFAAGNHDELTPSKGTAPVKSGARVDFQALPNSIYTIAVGAVNSLGVKSNYSQIGSSLVICAPSSTSDGSGLGILTTDNKGFYGYNPGLMAGDLQGFPDNTENFGGTSSATPAISGLVALMLQRNPNLGWRDVQEILMRSAAQVDADDSNWISANRTDHVAGKPQVLLPFQ
jgi:subtilisin family serine protease